MNNNNNEMKLPPDCTIYEVQELRDLLLTSCHSKSELILDFSGVEVVDTCFVQLLLALHKQLKHLGGTLKLIKLDNQKKEMIQALNGLFLLEESSDLNAEDLNDSNGLNDMARSMQDSTAMSQRAAETE